MNLLEDLKNPKKRALAQLVLYGIFFIFVFIIIGASNTKEKNYDEPVEYNESEKVEEVIPNNQVLNYQYSFIINDITVEGTFIDSENTFIIDDITYVKTDNTTYNQSTMEIVDDFNIDKYLYTSIEKLIENSEFIEKTTYKDNNEKITYLVNNEEYCYECYLIVEKNNYINKVILNNNIELNYTIE